MLTWHNLPTVVAIVKFKLRPSGASLEHVKWRLRLRISTSDLHQIEQCQACSPGTGPAQRRSLFQHSKPPKTRPVSLETVPLAYRRYSRWFLVLKKGAPSCKASLWRLSLALPLESKHSAPNKLGKGRFYSAKSLRPMRELELHE